MIKKILPILFLSSMLIPINSYAFESYKTYTMNDIELLDENKKNVILTLSEDETVDVIDEDENYYLILYEKNNNEIEGWIEKTSVQNRDFLIAEENINVINEENFDAQLLNTNYTATIKGTNVNIRKSPVDGDIICKLSTGHNLTVTDSVKKNGHTWYYVEFSYNGNTLKGYVIDTYVKIQITVDNSDSEFEAYLNEQGFPESYKPYLRILHKKYPKWKFESVQTNLTWNNVVNKESVIGKNLVPYNSPDSWKSTDKSAYDWETNTWYGFDGPTWVAASKEIVQFYLDPRNFLDESSIFQFETLEYKSYQSNEKNINNLLKGTFMSGNYTEPDGSIGNYSKTFIEIGEKIGISPYFIAARCYQEQGSGKSRSISGNASGYENLFNYYHIGAYPANGNTSVTNGLIYASKSDSSTYRPWNTRYKSLLGGADFIYKKYISKGQNTLYFQKFNVINNSNGYFNNQYMTNLQAAVSESSYIKKAYLDMNEEIIFKIPVYLNMPASACSSPGSEANPNNYIKTLTVDGETITPGFDPEIQKYTLIVDTDKININAAAVAVTSTVSGIGEVELKNGDNTIEVKCTAQNGDVRVYTLNITRKESKNDQSDIIIKSDKYNINNSIIKIDLNTDIKTLKTNITLYNCSLKILDEKLNEKKDSDIIKNGDLLKIYNENKEIKTYQFSVIGDLNNDGKINNGDLILMKKHILNINNLKNVYIESADLNNDGKINNGDLILMKKYILGING